MQANLLDITNERKEALIDRNVPSNKNHLCEGFWETKQKMKMEIEKKSGT